MADATLLIDATPGFTLELVLYSQDVSGDPFGPYELDEIEPGRYSASVDLEEEEIVAGAYAGVARNVSDEIAVARKYATLDGTVGPFEFLSRSLAIGASSGTNGAGQHAINVTVTRSTDDAAVRNVRVDVVGTDTYDNTNTDGEATLNVSDGEYVLRITPPFGYESVDDIEVEVDGDDEAVPIELTLIVTVAADAPYTNASLPVIDLSGNPVSGVEVTVAFVRYLDGADRTAVVIDDDAKKISEGGSVSIRLLRLARYTASYKVLRGQTKTITFDTDNTGSYEVVEPEA